MIYMGHLRDSLLASYQNESGELHNESQYVISEIFFSYIDHVSSHEDLLTENIVSRIRDDIYLVNLFIYDGSTFLAIDNRFRHIAGKINFSGSFAEFDQTGRTKFPDIREPDLDSDEIPFIIFYKFIPDKNLYIGYVNDYEHISDHLVNADRTIFNTINKIGWMSVILLFAGIGIVITITLAFLSRLVLRPIKSLNEALAKIGKKDFDLRIPSFRGDEMKNMIMEMSVQVQHAFLSMENQLKNIEEQEQIRVTATRISERKLQFSLNYAFLSPYCHLFSPA